MAVITISRLKGSGGSNIGKEVAKRLGYKFADKELIQKIMDEYSYFDFGKIYDSKLSLWNRYTVLTDHILGLYNRIILSIAKSGNVVIVGRGSFVPLAKYENVLNVMIYAPIQTRVSAVMASEGITEPAKAEEYIIEADKIRKSFNEYTYNIKWNRINNFDMAFNAGKLESSAIIEMIVTSAEALDKKSSISGSLTSNIPGDEILDNVIKKIF